MAPRVAIFGPNPLLTVAIERRGGRRHPHPPRRPGRLGGADGGRARRRAGPLRLHRRRDRQGPAAAARGDAGRAAPGRDGGAQRRLRQRPPQRRARAACHSAGRAALAPRGRRLFSVTLARRARLRPARGLQPLPGRRPAARDLRRPRRRREARTARRCSSTSPSPRLDSALEGRPDLVKINDWELAEYVSGPVDTPDGSARRRSSGCGTPARARDRHARRRAGAGAATTARRVELVPPRSSAARARAAATR